MSPRFRYRHQLIGGRVSIRGIHPDRIPSPLQLRNQSQGNQRNRGQNRLYTLRPPENKLAETIAFGLIFADFVDNIQVRLLHGARPGESFC